MRHQCLFDLGGTDVQIANILGGNFLRAVALMP